MSGARRNHLTECDPGKTSDMYWDLLTNHPYLTVAATLSAVLSVIGRVIERHRRRQLEVETLKFLRKQNVALPTCARCGATARSRKASFCTQCGVAF